MLIQIILFSIIGIFSGILTGITPGIHINLIGSLIIILSKKIILHPLYSICFIVSMAITHTFIDFIPSIFLGCPDTDTELSVLPGHKMLKKGQGQNAIALTTYGSIAAIFLLVLIAFPSVLIIPLIYDSIKNIMPYILIIISLTLIYLENKKLMATFVFFLTGLLGLIILNLENLNQPLLPLLTGLFGSSMILISIKNKTKIPKQEPIQKIKINKIRPLLGSLIASPLCSFLPGLGSGQAAIIGNTITKNNTKGFLILLGATNTLVMGFSFLSLYSISKTRTGAAVAIQKLSQNLDPKILFIIILITLFSGIVSFFITLKISELITKQIDKINYTYISIATLIILSLITIGVSGILGLAILIISTLTGIYCFSLKVRRTNMMGCLLLPVIIFYLF